MIVAGIDEAGLGPILGPLVVSASVFRSAEPVDISADGQCSLDFWQALSRCTTTRASRKHPERLLIADSKKVYARRKTADGEARRDLTALERGVLTMWLSSPAGHAADALPNSLAGLLDVVSPAEPGLDAATQRAAACPWYGPCDLPLPQAASTTDIELVANNARVTFRQAGLELANLRAEPLFAPEFNRLVDAIQNKATVTLGQTCRLLAWVLQQAQTEDAHITIDRQGGRVHYLPTLQRMVPDGHWKVLDESDTRSAYRLSRGQQMVTLTFAIKAESQSLPTALASMLSKYVRELCMECFNRFWATKVDDLAPTAGYYTDGMRFFEQIRPTLPSLNLAEADVLRSR